MRSTSTEAYRKITDSGLLKKNRLEIYNILYVYGPLTSAETFKIMLKTRPQINVLTQSRARFTELRGMNAIRELGEKVCTITGHRSIAWDVTEKIPVALKTPLTKKQKIANIIAELHKLDREDTSKIELLLREL